MRLKKAITHGLNSRVMKDLTQNFILPEAGKGPSSAEAQEKDPDQQVVELLQNQLPQRLFGLSRTASKVLSVMPSEFRAWEPGNRLLALHHLLIHVCYNFLPVPQ